LNVLVSTKSEELKIYKKHLEINHQIDCRRNEIVGLSNLIEENISKMDEKIKSVLSNVEKV